MSERGEPWFFGVLVTYRRPEQLAITLGRLAAQTRHLDGLVVVDNASDSKTREIVSRQTGPTTYLDPGDNVGPAGGFALGMTHFLQIANLDDWIVLIDDDDPPFFDDAVEHTVTFAAQMAGRIPSVGGVGISGGRFDYRKGVVQRVGDAEIRGAVEVDHITAGGLPAYRVGAVRSVGVFLPELFFGFEELEYGLRLTAAGHPLFADGEQWSRRKRVKRDAGLLPPEAESVARAAKSKVRVDEPTWRRYYSMRNLVFILRRHDARGAALRVAVARGILKPLVNLFVHPGLAWASLKSNWQAINDGWSGNMGRTVEPRQ